jgi:hypothetical protein
VLGCWSDGLSGGVELACVLGCWSDGLEWRGGVGMRAGLFKWWTGVEVWSWHACWGVGVMEWSAGMELACVLRGMGCWSENTALHTFD